MRRIIKVKFNEVKNGQWYYEGSILVGNDNFEFRASCKGGWTESYTRKHFQRFIDSITMGGEFEICESLNGEIEKRHNTKSKAALLSDCTCNFIVDGVPSGKKCNNCQRIGIIDFIEVYLCFSCRSNPEILKSNRLCTDCQFMYRECIQCTT